MAFFVSPQAVGFCCFWLVLLGCFLVGYSGMAWFGYLVFLAYLGGLLVVFLYSMVLAPSPYFGKVSNVFFSKEVGVAVGFFAMFIIFFAYYSWSEVSGGNWFASEFVNFYFSGGVSFSWLGNSLTFPVIGGLLLMCMVSVTKICGDCSGSLRCFE
nr:NADH dehydrogenase subunit 6 [Propeamussium sp. mt1]